MQNKPIPPQPLTTQEQIAEMIYRWLHKDQVTHVLSFWDRSPEQRADYLDIAQVCIQIVQRSIEE